jgi:phenylacetate-coenzyme A ligase PaaK-like adenylate-forming protein
LKELQVSGRVTIMQSLRTIRARRFKPLLQEQEEFYSRRRTPDEIRRWQLEQLNQQWQTIRCRVPFFSRLAREKSLPAQFSSTEEFRHLMPVIERRTIQRHRDEFSDPSKPPDYLRTTGGSTAEPIQLPAWNSELAYTKQDLWYARSWFGVTPADKLFLIWGHSHLLGNGVVGQLNRLKREAKDALLGYCRFSAYDLSERAMRQAGDAMLAFRPGYVVAYSVALDRFARVNAARKDAFRQLGLKVALATAECFPRPDSKAFIADILGCPVAMEYGAVETGLIAHQHPSGNFKVFWGRYFLDGSESETLPGCHEVFLTSLYPRCTPLVRYRIGDLISSDPNDCSFDQDFGRVVGRCNDWLALPDGGRVHSEAFTHAVKECPFVLSFQVVQRDNGEIQFRYVPAARVKANEPEIRRRLATIHPALRDVSFEEVPFIPQTMAGKTRSIVREEGHAG